MRKIWRKLKAKKRSWLRLNQQRPAAVSQIEKDLLNLKTYLEWDKLSMSFAIATKQK